MSINIKKINNFRRLSLLTVIAVYFLILVGGIVRSTGSGMGCPDWPKCFGSWVPPTSVDQLPVDYQDQYAALRAEKNIKFISYLELVGLDEQAQKIRSDKSILIEEEFNVAKTWTEYVNRLIGAIIGLLIFATFIYSLNFFSSKPIISIIALVAMVLTGIQGWFGSIVVSTNLLQWTITVHMVLAIVIVGVLIWIYFQSLTLGKVYQENIDKPQPRLFALLWIALVLMFIQIMLGTQVRESLDVIASSFDNLFRERWIDNLGIDFIIHRSFSLVLLGIHIYLIVKLYQITPSRSRISQMGNFILALMLIEIGTGAAMAYFAIPAFVQPIHLLVGTLIIGAEFLLILHLNYQHRLLAKSKII